MKRFAVVLVALAAITLLFSALPHSIAASGPCGDFSANGVYLFSERVFSGECIYSAGEPERIEIGVTEALTAVRSIILRPAEDWVVWVASIKEERLGRSRVDHSDPYLSPDAWGQVVEVTVDRAHPCIDVVEGTPVSGVFVFSEPVFRGTCQHFQASVPDFTSTIFGDRGFRSIVVVPSDGWRVYLYAMTNFLGATRRVSQEVDLSGNWWSMSVHQVLPPPPINTPDAPTATEPPRQVPTPRPPGWYRAYLPIAVCGYIDYWDAPTKPAPYVTATIERPTSPPPTRDPATAVP